MMNFGTPELLPWLWCVPVALALGVWAMARRRAMLARFINTGLWRHVVPGGRPAVVRPAVKWLLCSLALGAVVFSLARPQWNLPGQEPKRESLKRSGRDVCFLIDVSKSMLAEDLAPNRLARAKLWVSDVLEVVRGDRVAIVPFAGQAVVKCPLTHDYAFARMALEELSPQSVAKGGTNIGDAVRVALTEVFDTNEANFKDIILITDGEDHDSSPVEAAEAAGKAGVRLIAIGIGDEVEGTRIPITDDNGRRTFAMYNGKEVITKLDGQTLRRMSAATPGGQYYPVSTGTIELDKIYRSIIGSADKREMSDAEGEVKYEDRFQWFLGAALAVLLLELFIGERRRALKGARA